MLDFVSRQMAIMKKVILSIVILERVGQRILFLILIWWGKSILKVVFNYNL
jgi:hypothetical protein